MKISRFIFVVFFLISSLNASLKEEYYFGVTIYKFDRVHQNKVKRIILKTISKMAKAMDEKINIIFIEGEENLLKDLKKFEKMNMGVIYSSFYLENKEEIKKIAKSPFLFTNNGTEKTQYYLIANKKSKIKSIKDLRGKSFASLTIDDNYATWVDYLVRKNLNTSYESIIKSQKKYNKNEKLLLNVYFNTVDFTVVSKVVYEDMILLNPAIKKNLVIIEKSDPIFFFALGIFHKKTPKRLVDKFQLSIENGEFNKSLGDLYKMLNLYGVQSSSFEDLKSLDKFYSDYLKLKKSK